MSFDVFLQSSRSSGRSVEVTDPFTGETQVSRVNDPLSERERNALLSVLQTYGVNAPDEFGVYTLLFRDGVLAEVDFDDLIDATNLTGGSVSLRGDSEVGMQFLFSIADAGNFVMRPAMEGNPVIVTKRSTADAVSNEVPDVIIANSAADLTTIMSTGIQDWEKFRRQVT